METSTKIKIAAVLAVILGPFLAYTGHQEKERLAKLEKEGVTVDGFIEGGDWKKGKGSYYKFEVSYAPQNGAPTKQTFKVTSDYFSAHASEATKMVTNPEAKVRYLPSDVQDSAILVGGSTDNTSLFVGGIAAFVIGLITLGVMFFLKK